MAEHVVDPAKIDARVAELEADALAHDLVADALEELADAQRRSAYDLRVQNHRLIEAAQKHGYPKPRDHGSTP